MARRKKGNPVNGWVVLDKPSGITSTQAVSAVRWAYQAQKAGHAGTLDPLATGILPIALGEATKTVPFVVDGAKTYRFTVRWGAETSTDDSEGPVTNASELRPLFPEIEALLSRFIGEIMQTPPQFSAIKINGERAYDIARDGETVALEPRPITIDRLQLTDMPDAETSIFEADCGKGTYVRALARDMGRALGCYGHIIALRRTRVGPFHEPDCVGLDQLRAAANAGNHAALSDALKRVDMALSDIAQLIVSPQDAADLVQGRSILIRGRDAPALSGPAYAECKGRLIALGEIEKGALHPTRVFHLD